MMRNILRGLESKVVRRMNQRTEEADFKRKINKQGNRREQDHREVTERTRMP
uniref:Uncharacterized protein n=1 Tax=Arundo donax TaxID=35708 RepID=A0A0A9A6C3_ARUDO